MSSIGPQRAAPSSPARIAAEVAETKRQIDDVTPPDDSALDDERRYAAQTTFLPQLARVIEEWYGERCSEHEPDCVVCQLWKAYDILNSFVD